MTSSWRLQLLGNIRADGPLRSVERFPTRKTGSLIAWLALHPDVPQPREMLAERFWPGRAPSAGRNSLSQALSALRRLLENEADAEAIIIADRTSVHVAAGMIETDVAAFKAALHRVNSTEKGSSGRTPQLRVALDLYQGELMPAHYDEWVLQLRDEFAERHRRALSELIDHLLDDGAVEEAVVSARRALGADPTGEQAHHDLIRSLIAADRPGEAVRHFRALTTLLQEDMGVAPSDAIRSLVAHLVVDRTTVGPDVEYAAARPLPAEEESWNGIATCLVARAPSDLPTTDASQLVRALAHIVHDFGAHVVQAGVTETILLLRHASDGVALADEADRATGLPLRIGLHTGELHGAPVAGAEAPPIIERAVRLTELIRPGHTVMTQATLLLARAALLDEDRLVSLGRFDLGAGDRTALYELARVVWIELAALDDPDEVPRVIAEAVGVPPEALARPIEALATELGDGPAILVLDNLEQLLPESSTTVAAILDACRGVVCLCTSRRRLGLEGEREYSLAPLPVPEIGELERRVRQSPSVELFVDRAQALQPDLTLDSNTLLDVARLCASLEGVPLAIELAAARAAVLTPRQMNERIADRLRWLADERADLSDRQRSLRGAIDWSFDLLSDAQKRAFTHASVFRGGWDLDGAETVLDDPLVVDRLAELRDASLITASVSGGVVRFRMLEMLRTYANERLMEDGTAETLLRARHAAHFAGIADEAKHALTGPDQAYWFDRLASDHDNFRAVISWSMSLAGDVGIGLQIACGLQYYWYTRGHWAQGVEQIRSLLDAGPDQDPGLRARAARVAGGLATFLDRFEEATALLEEALKIQRTLDDRHGELAVVVQLAVLARRNDDGARSLQLAEECEAGYRALDDSRAKRGLAAVLNLIGLAHRREGETETARPYFEESLALIRAQGDVKAMADILENLGQLELAAGRLEAARGRIIEVFECTEAINSRWGVLRAMTAAGYLHTHAGDLKRATRCHAAVSSLESDLEERSDTVNAERSAAIATLRDQLGDEVFDREWALGAGLSWSEAIEQATVELARTSE